MSIPSSQANIFDMGALNDLKSKARERSPEAIKAVAQQFEALMTQMLLKNMRASLQAGGLSGLGDSESTQFYQNLYDQQLSLVLSKQGGLGVAAAMERLMNGQLSTTRAVNYDIKAGAEMPGTAATSGSSGSTLPGAADKAISAAQSFVEQTWPQAQDAARRLGVPTHFLVAQAALETGWGKKQIRLADGRSSYNLFNIKAGQDWKGPVAEVMSTEFENGKPVSRLERFRAYASFEQAFDDYARLIGDSPRYASVLGQTNPQQFAQALQQAGYATDPAYAAKLARVINGTTLRQGMLASSS